jgi:hypothetical protein
MCLQILLGKLPERHDAMVHRQVFSRYILIIFGCNLFFLEVVVFLRSLKIVMLLGRRGGDFTRELVLKHYY